MFTFLTNWEMRKQNQDVYQIIFVAEQNEYHHQPKKAIYLHQLYFPSY